MPRIIPVTLLFLFLPFLQALQAQSDDAATGELLENFFRDNEQATESDAQLFLEYLDNLRQRPLDLNWATREELAALHLLNEIQIENFLAYRSSLGPLLNALELQAVPGWELTDIRRILPFAGFNTGLDTRNRPLWRGLWEGQNEMLVRWGRPTPPRYTTSVEGQPNAWALRYRHNFDSRLRFGFTAENDPGEAFFKGSNAHGFDFYSAHVYLEKLNKTVDAVALGDFAARLGQGLLLQTSFAPGKSAETTSIARGGRKIRPYAAFGEAFFLRGAAASFCLGKNWDLTAMASNRLRDANVLAPPPDSIDPDFPEVVFSSLQTSGLHRTASEVADEKAIREWLGAISVSRNWSNGQISANYLLLEYDKPWRPSPAPYRQFVFAGNRLSAASIDYFWRQRNWYAFGEIARSGNGGMAAINGILFSAERHVTLALLHRNLGRDYQSVYAAPFAETSGASNEQGLYLGADVRFGRKWQINSYLDLWKHPWLRFGVDAPSTGSEYLSRITWTPLRGVSFYALWQLEIKERNSDVEGLQGLVVNKRSRLRLHASYKVGEGIELRSRVEWSWFEKGAPQVSKGILAYQEMLIRPLGAPVSGSLRFAVFDTPDFDSRIYTFENDLFAAISIPGFAGRGARYFLNLNWRVNEWLRLEGRFEQTYQRRASSASGFTGRQSFWKLQARFKF